ncbi:N-acetylglucosamine-6-phosphate deacetylase [Allorhizobium undicola]|uniref:N-acetylglucosamine-6-phosphate deacetylase n=1 Tax=Allorhizobium undicola TaxID=78527 RepID=UPI0009FCEAAC|nr:N-acetylglucosamine-6-phosphate deacetylase [Allorhizobium undicola]
MNIDDFPPEAGSGLLRRFAIRAALIFDGDNFLQGHALVLREGLVEGLAPWSNIPEDLPVFDAPDALLTPGFVDLQVNGGGGALFNNQPTLKGIRRICETHARYGTTALLPTVITDRPDIMKACMAAGSAALAAGIPGFLGLHLEGPHLSLVRKGTHHPALIREMCPEDLDFYIGSSGNFGKALITIAPENVSESQVTALVNARFVVSLGHTDTSFEIARRYVGAGASMVTHLFNAMSQMGNREPGLVGAALALGEVSCGLIADGFHVDPTSMSIALRAKQGPGRVFLVTDAMSTIGTQNRRFELNGRTVYRREGRLTLADGTLAGADIDMLSCLRFVHRKLDVPLGEALNMASLYPAEALGVTDRGKLAPGRQGDFLVLSPDLELHSTWIGGRCIYKQKMQRGYAS